MSSATHFGSKSIHACDSVTTIECGDVLLFLVHNARVTIVWEIAPSNREEMRTSSG